MQAAKKMQFKSLPAAKTSKTDFNRGYTAAIRKVVLHLAQLDGALGRQDTPENQAARRIVHEVYCVYAESLTFLDNEPIH